MNVIDISMTIEPDMMVYKNYDHKKPVFENSANFKTGSHYETDLKLNLHTGTHMDAPLHMIEGGETIEKYDISRLMTTCRVLDLSHVVGMVTKADLEAFDIVKDEFILLKTRNSSEEAFNTEFISLRKDGAKYLSEIGINGVGIDALGIERGQDDHMTHKYLLDANVIILEGLRLGHVEAKSYELIALPLKIANVEASLIRAVLIEK